MRPATIAIGLLLVIPAWADPVAEAISKEGRLPADVERDSRSKPAEIIPLLALEPGDRVADIFAGGGYYSELLASVVGADGEVLLHNNRGFRAWGINLLNDRFDGDRHVPNVTQHDSEIDDLGFGESTLDAALMVMAYHDMYVVPKRYNGEKYVAVGPPADVGRLMRQIFAALKPGARFVVVDHAADPRTALEEVLELHRIHEDFAKSSISAYGFDFVTSSQALRNSNDDLGRIVFDSDLQGRTDRFVLVFEKRR